MNKSFQINPLKLGLGLFILAMLILAVMLWRSTPELFEHFSTAFCAH